MKLIMIGIFLLGTVTNNAFANARNDKKIFNAMDVEAVQVNPGIAGSYRLIKNAGALECAKSRLVYPGAKDSYDCFLNQDGDFAQTYKALDVNAVQANPGIVGAYRLVKKIGGLECTNSKIVYPGAQEEFYCSLAE